MPLPNIVLIFPDQWRGDCLSAAGHPVVETPFLDEMAAEGVRFTRAYTPCPSCIAARASLATGLSPNSAGRIGYKDGLPWPYPNTFMRMLRDSGYQTLCSGKTHFYPTRARLGFEELALYEMPWQDPDHPSDYHLWLRRQTGGLVRDTAEQLDSNAWVVHPWTHDESLHPNSWTVTAAQEMLERRDPTRPFLLQVNFHRPHPPLDPPLAYFDRYASKELPPVPVGDWCDEFDHPVAHVATSTGRLPQDVHDRQRRGYYAQISHLDFQIGRLRRYLMGRKLLGDTWIIFASDHGEQLGDHRLFRKVTPFEGSARVPLIVRPPQRLDTAGTTVETAVTLTDLMPTILELGGVPVPEDVEGLSLLPTVRGQGRIEREFIHGEHAPCWQYLTDGREKFAWNSSTGRQWLFDLVADPTECRNLIDRPEAAERVKLWRQRLVDALCGRTEDGLVKDGELAPGRSTPPVREWIAEE